MVDHRWVYCEHCERVVVLCGKCGNNTCNGGHGEVDGQECDKCEEAYELDMSTNDLIEQVAMTMAVGNNGGTWDEHYKEEQKEFWRQRAQDVIKMIRNEIGGLQEAQDTV